MRGASGDEGDSRTASVGLPRARSNGSSAASRQSSTDGKVGRKQGRRMHNMAGKDLQDLVPKGGVFGAAPLDVDPANSDATSPSASSSANHENESDGKDDRATKGSKQSKRAVPALNWNKGSRSSIRTTLGGKATRVDNNNDATPTTVFNAVNDKYFRSRSASVSSDEEKDITDTGDGERPNAFKRVKKDDKTYFVDDSDGSETGEVSEGGDSIMLNMEPRKDRRGLDGVQDDDEYVPFLIDPQPAATGVTPINRAEGEPTMHLNERKREPETGVQAHVSKQMSKEEAFRVFTQTYSTPPLVLADLNVKDLQSQARHFHYDRTIHDIDLSRPFSCTECLQGGHLSIVCPTKECEWCGAWNLHESNLCPTHRRCQKCRESGHDVDECQSALKGSASEVPCDMCGSDTHIEHDCDLMWKFPRYPPYRGPIVVSISCSYCCSRSHILGDCPLRPGPSRSSSWSLKDYDPATITNLNSVLGPQPVWHASNNRGGMRIRGRARPPRSPTPDSDDRLPMHPSHLSRSNQRGGRGSIRFGSNIGRNRDLSGAVTPPLPPDSRQPYRDRDDGYGSSQNRQRRRSRSPRPPPPRPPPGGNRGKIRKPPPPNLGRGRGGRGRGRGGYRDEYRPG